MTNRPYSIMPNISKKNTGATMANSTAEAPRRLLRRPVNRKSIGNLSNITSATACPDSLARAAFIVTPR
jgi:hypothetical protein